MNLEALAPVGGKDRVALIDILRGFAILGILLVNMQFFVSPIYLAIAPVQWWTGTLDRAVEILILFLAQGKFYTLFSFLFGVGLAVQMERCRARGVKIVPLFARRLTWLLLIGLVHAFLIWFGDILVSYALFGFVLLLFRNRSYKTLVIWTVVLLVVPLLMFGGLTALLELGKLSGEGAREIEQSFAENRTANLELLERAREVYPVGSYLEILPLRAGQVGVIYMITFVFGFGLHIMGIFLIGLNVGRRGILQQIRIHLPTVRRITPWLLGLGLTGTTIFVVAQSLVEDPGMPAPLLLLGQLGELFGSPGLTFFYVCSIVLLCQSKRWGPWLGLLAPVGRMALTNYLTHSIVMTLVTNGYGLGFYGRISPTTGLLLTLTLYGLQIPLSGWWLRRFRFGPAEWLWRSLTYQRFQPMRRR